MIESSTPSWDQRSVADATTDEDVRPCDVALSRDAVGDGRRGR